MNALNEIIKYHRSAGNLQKLEIAADALNLKKKINLLESILSQHVSLGNFKESLEISKKIGRDLTRAEKRKLFFAVLKKHDESQAEIIANLFQEPERSRLLIGVIERYIKIGYPSLAASIANTLLKQKTFWLKKCLIAAKKSHDLEVIETISSYLGYRVDLEEILTIGLNMGGSWGYYLARDCCGRLGRKITEEEFEKYLKSSRSITSDAVSFLSSYMDTASRKKSLQKLLKLQLNCLKGRKTDNLSFHECREAFNVVENITRKLDRQLRISEAKIFLRWLIKSGSLDGAQEILKLINQPLKDADLEIILVKQLNMPCSAWGSSENFKWESILEVIKCFSEEKKAYYLKLLFK